MLILGQMAEGVQFSDHIILLKITLFGKLLYDSLVLYLAHYVDTVSLTIV